MREKGRRGGRETEKGKETETENRNCLELLPILLVSIV